MSWEYCAHILIVICLYSILAQSFNLSFGIGRLFNLAHVATYALGAYVSALAAVELEWSFLTCLISSAFFCAIFSLLIGAISARLENDYFAIGTLAFSSFVAALLINWQSLTRGVLGITAIPRPTIAGIDFSDNSNFLFLSFIIALFIQLFLFAAFRGSYARSLAAQAENESAALSIAINAGKCRTVSFIVASSCAGIAGSLFAFYINYIDPSSFSLNESVLILSIVVVGRPGSFIGVLMATALMIIIPEAIRFIDAINNAPQILGPLRQLIYAAILFCTVWINRARLFPQQREF